MKKMEEPVIELIDFNEPIDGQISVRDIHWSQDAINLREFLREKLSSFGLIQKILVFNAEIAGLWYGYVNFYSPRVAKKVHDTFEDSPLEIESHPCKMNMSRNPHHKNRRLLLYQCNDLANYYLGFNGWTSEILYHQLENSTESEQKYATAVKLSFKDFKDHFVEGVGMSVAKFKNLEEKMSEMRVVQKNSKSAALLNAFSKVIIVLVHIGDKTKVSLEIDHSRTDPFHYNSIWNDNTILDVQEVIGEEEISNLFEFEF